MGHMKKLFAALLALVMVSFIGAKTASAHEGNVSISGANISCTAISLWQSGQYRVTGRCEGLVYPYQTQYDRYVLWAKASGNGDIIRVAEVERGYFDGNIANGFDNVFITAESTGIPNRPSQYQVATGSVSTFNFDKSQAVATPAPVAAGANTGSTISVQQGAATAATSGSTVGAVVGRIVTSLLVIILVIVGIAIGASLIFRSRGSVSA